MSPKKNIFFNLKKSEKVQITCVYGMRIENCQKNCLMAETNWEFKTSTLEFDFTDEVNDRKGRELIEIGGRKREEKMKYFFVFRENHVEASIDGE